MAKVEPNLAASMYCGVYFPQPPPLQAERLGGRYVEVDAPPLRGM